MTDVWLPGYRRVDLGLDGAGYVDTAHPKLLWHTTEGSSVASARAAFEDYPPHVCYDPRTDEAEQYIPLNRAAYACKANDREYVIQVEIVGFASQSHTWSDEILGRLYRRVVAPITAAVGVAPAVCSYGFLGEGDGILASPDSRIRLTLAQLRAFSGHLGHQHMPSPDAHWDPGRLPINKILAYAQGDDMPLTPDDGNVVWAAKDPVAGTIERHKIADWLAWSTYYSLYAMRDVGAVKVLLATVLANQQDDLSDTDVLARLDAKIDAQWADLQARMQQARAEDLAAMKAAVREVVGDDNAGQADAIVDALVSRLVNPALEGN